MGQIIIIIVVFWLFKDIIFGILGWIFEKFCDLLDFLADVKYEIERIIRRSKTKRYENRLYKERQQRLLEIEKAYEDKEYKLAVTLFRAMLKEGFNSKREKEKYYCIAAKSFAEIAKTPVEWEEARTWAMISQANSENDNRETLTTVEFMGVDVFKEQDGTIYVAQELLDSGEVEDAISLLKEREKEGNVYAILGLAEVMLNTMKNEEDIKNAKAMLEKARVFADKKTMDEFDKKYNESWVVNYFAHFSKYKELFEKAKKADGDKFFDLTEKAFAEMEKAAEYRKDADFYVSLVKIFMSNANMYVQSNACKVSYFEKHLESYKKARKWAEKAIELGNESARSELDKLEKLLSAGTTALGQLNAFYDLTDKAKSATDSEKGIGLLAEAAENLEKMARYVLTDKICEVITDTYVMVADFQERVHRKGDDSFTRYAEFYKHADVWCKRGAALGSDKSKEKLPKIEERLKTILLALDIEKEKADKNTSGE